jgi:hypothetical protein
MTMVTFDELLTTMKQIYDATKIHVVAETDPDIRQGMEINLDLLDRALTAAGWPH